MYTNIKSLKDYFSKYNKTHAFPICPECFVSLLTHFKTIEQIEILPSSFAKTSPKIYSRNCKELPVSFAIETPVVYVKKYKTHCKTNTFYV